jgi:hypothetical protein
MLPDDCPNGPKHVGAHIKRYFKCKLQYFVLIKSAFVGKEVLNLSKCTVKQQYKLSVYWFTVVISHHDGGVPNILLKNNHMWFNISINAHLLVRHLNFFFFLYFLSQGHAVAQLVEALRYPVGRSRVPFPKVSLEFFIPTALLPWGSTQPL